MDEIALQLKEEIKSLQQYIEHTEKRVLATSWVASLLDPFEQIEGEFAEEEIKEVVEALTVAQKQFSINGHLAERIDDVIGRYKHLIESKDEDEQNLQEIPAKDAEFSPLGLSSYADDEEHISLDGLHTPDEAQTEIPLPAPTAQLGDLETVFNTTDPPDKIPDELPDKTLIDTAVPEPPIEDHENTIVEISSTSDQLPDQHPDELFASALLAEQDPQSAKQLQEDTGDPDELPDKTLIDTAVPEPPIEDHENTIVEISSTSDQLPDQHPDELFASALLAEQDPQSAKQLQEDTGDPDELFEIVLDPPQAETSNNDVKENTLDPSGPTPPKATEHPSATGNPDGLFAATHSKPNSDKKKNTNRKSRACDIFSHQINLEELLLDLGIDIPEQDKTQLKHLHKQKLESRSIAQLKLYPPAAGQYVLIPRIRQFIHQGTIYPCTVKNLARTFIAIFADIKDLMQYKAHPFLDSEVPEFGWSIVPAEAPQETLNKNYLHQTQFLRFLSTATRLPSHLVRRRTLVEAVYDIIASRMHLESPMQKATLDWTASGLSKSDFICVFHSEQGLRIRHIKRTQRNQALGLCPNW